jgi:cytochrome c551
MSTRARSFQLLAILGCALALGIAGCGSDSGGGSSSSGGGSTSSGGSASADGKTVFEANCSSCHTLKDADASGSFGPNLDQLTPDAATVQKQVENGGGGMPAFGGKLSDAEIKAVATYVSTSAGK